VVVLRVLGRLTVEEVAEVEGLDGAGAAQPSGASRERADDNRTRCSAHAECQGMPRSGIVGSSRLGLY
jgi:hypothetical protein